MSKSGTAIALGLSHLKRKAQSKDVRLAEAGDSSLPIVPPADSSDKPPIVAFTEPTPTNISISTKDSSPLNFHELMTRTSSQEFFETLDNASAEELDLLLRGQDSIVPRVSLADSIEKYWRHVMTVPPEPRNFRSILSWWESRRALYNAVVGSIGLFMAVLVCWHYQLGLFILGWALSVCIVYAILANLCYSLGAFSELIVRLFHKYHRFGPIAFTLGLAFSIVVVVAQGMSLLAGLPGLQG
jgi:hypothetical protein